MPAAVAIPAIGTVLGAGINLLGQRSASNTQQQESQAALDFAKEQAAQQQKNYEEQQAALQKQWEARQAQLAPYNAAKLGLLNYYGLGGTQAAPSSTPPPGFGGSGLTGTAAPIPKPISIAGIASNVWQPFVGPSSAPSMAPTPASVPVTLPVGSTNFSDLVGV